MTLLAKHWLNTPVLSLSCANIALFPETSVGSLSELGDVIMPPSPLLQWENGSLLFLQGIFKELAPWRSTHQPLWEWGVGGVSFVLYFSPWLHEQLKPVTYRSWKLHAEN